MTFKLNVVNVPRDNDTERERKEVDWDALNAHIIAAAGTATKKRSIPGIISGIIDLGIQEREPLEVDWNEKDAQKPGVEEYEENGKRKLRVPLKPVQSVAITVDFPQILVNKGKFFGEEDAKPLPLRLLLNGEFGYRDTSTGKWLATVKRGYGLNETKHDDGKWAFSKNSMIYRLADAVGILDSNGHFTKDRVGELLGGAAQFTIRLYMKSSGGRDYLTEEIALAGIIPEGVPVPDTPEGLVYGINVNAPNDPEALRVLRKSIKNTIKRAHNYQGSVIQRELEGEGDEAQAQAAPEAPPAPPAPPAVASKGKTKVKAEPPKNVDEEWEEDEIPF